VPTFPAGLTDRGGECGERQTRDRLTDPKIADAPRLAGELFSGHGWRYEVWSGCEPVVLDNVPVSWPATAAPGSSIGLIAHAWREVRDGETVGEVDGAWPGCAGLDGAAGCCWRCCERGNLTTDLVPAAVGRCGPAQAPMSALTAPLRIGTRLDHDGARFAVVEIDGRRLVLRQLATGGLRQVDLALAAGASEHPRRGRGGRADPVGGRGIRGSG